MRRIYLSIVILICVIFFTSLLINAESNELLLLISNVYYDKDYDIGLIGPEILVDRGGKWREAGLKDLWIGQQFKTFSMEGESEIRHPLNITVNFIDDYVAQCEVKKKSLGSFGSMAVYDKNKEFNYIGIGPLIEPQEIDREINLELQDVFVDDKNIIDRLYKVIKNDFYNIKKDFPVNVQLNIKDYLLGDLNGDGSNDIILILGDKYFGAPESGPAVIIAYVKIDGEFNRIPISYWEKTSDFTSWPKLLFTKDFNKDNTEELFIGEANSDSTVPIVYSWFDNGLQKVFHGKRELWKW